MERNLLAGGLGLFYGLPERRGPLKYASSPLGIHCLVRPHYNSRVREITHSQAEHVSLDVSRRMPIRSLSRM